MDVEVLRMGGGVGLEAFQRLVVLQDADRVLAHPMNIPDIIQIPGLALDGDLRESPRICRDHRHAGRHRFERGEAKAFIFGGEQEEVGHGEDLLHLLLLADESGVVDDVELAAEGFGLGAFGSVADEEQLAGDLLADDLEDADDILDAFDLAEVGGMHQDAFAVGGDHPAESVDRFAVKPAGVDKIMNDADLFFNVEGAEGFIAQILRDGRDGVALVDGEGDDRGEGLVAAHEGDVRTVQGRDHRDIASLRLDDLLGHIGRGGMGDGVVNMQEVELVVVDDVDHGAGQGRLVGGIVEERVGGDAHLVVKDVRVELVQTHRLLVGDKVNLVAFVGQGFSQFSGEYAAAAESRITDDSYAHGLTFRSAG